MACITMPQCVNTFRLEQNDHQFADDIFNCIFFNENHNILIKILLKFVLRGQINNALPLLQAMAWCLLGTESLHEPILT